MLLNQRPFSLVCAERAPSSRRFCPRGKPAPSRRPSAATATTPPASPSTSAQWRRDVRVRRRFRAGLPRLRPTAGAARITLRRPDHETSRAASRGRRPGSAHRRHQRATRSQPPWPATHLPKNDKPRVADLWGIGEDNARFLTADARRRQGPHAGWLFPPLPGVTNWADKVSHLATDAARACSWKGAGRSTGPGTRTPPTASPRPPTGAMA